MHIIEQKILNKFKKEPMREISTTELVRESNPEEYSNIISKLKDPLSDKQIINQAKRRKGQLHRRILYHLNNLIKEGVLKVGSIKGKGEKYFALNIEEGKLIIEKKHRQIAITKPSISTSLIEDYEINNIVHKYDQSGWITKLNCILLESSNHEGINRFYELVYNCFSEVNDCLGLNNFESIIQKSLKENIDEIMKRFDMDTKDHGILACLMINVRNITDEKKILSFITSYTKLNPRNIIIIFKTEGKEIKKRESFFKSVINELSKEELRINIHDKNAHAAPIIMGKAGPYTIKEEEWKEYEESIRGKTIGLAMAHTSIAIDCQAFFRKKSPSELKELTLKLAKTLLKVSASQRKRSNEYFERINEMNKPNTKKFFSYTKNYIRFWNYSLYDEKKQKKFLSLLEESKDEVKKFCAAERTIYRSCGIPFNFDVTFSTVFRRFSNKLSERNYQRSIIKRMHELDEEEMNKKINAKEKLAEIFGGSDRMRFHRKGSFNPEEIVKELLLIMNTRRLPMITYDFTESKGDTKLTSFMGS